MSKLSFFTNILITFFLITFFLVNPNLVSADYDVPSFGWLCENQPSCGTGSYSVIGGQCEYSYYAYKYVCNPKTYSGSKSCTGYALGGFSGDMTCSGCGIMYNYTKCTDASCETGGANGESWYTRYHPCCTATTGSCSTTTNTCTKGTVSGAGTTEVTTTGINNVWYCNGSCGGDNTSCSSTLCTKITGSCGATNTCSAGTVSGVGTSITATGMNNIWSCNGSCTGGNVSCSSWLCNKVNKIDGVCGSDHRNEFAQTPTNLCNPGTPSTVGVGTTTYTWTCNGTDGACPVVNAENPPCYAVRDVAPTPIITPIPVPPSPTDPAPNPGGGQRLQNCQFSNPNSVTIKFAVTDPNGINDVAGVYFRFKESQTNTYGPVVPTAAGVVTFSDMDITSLPYGTYTIQGKADDTRPGLTSGWVDLAFTFKKWDCQVDVDGSFYDSSVEGPSFACNIGDTVGFSTLVPSGTPFQLVYVSTIETVPKNMNNDSPYFTGELDWRYTYSIQKLDNYPGVINSLKIGNSNPDCVIWNSGIVVSKFVNPYVNTPTISLKYSAVMDQKPWFRVKDGGVLAKIRAGNRVPVTCDRDVTDCKTSVNGLVWSDNVDLSGSDESLTSEVQPQPYSGEHYAMMKYDFYGGKDIGTTFIDSLVEWPEDIGNIRGVIFIEGNLNINQNVEPSGNDYVFFIVKGNIGIGESVTKVNGMFYADGTINALGENDTQLAISGSLYGRSGVNLSRSYVTKRNNNTAPAVEVTYDPNLMFKLPKGMWETYNNWTME